MTNTRPVPQPCPSFPDGPRVLLAALWLILIGSVTYFAVQNFHLFGSGVTTGVATTNVRLRQEPTTSSVTLAILNDGDSVTVLDRSGDWFMVNYRGRIGFVYGRYLSVSGPTVSNHGNGVRLRFQLMPEHRRILEAAGWLDYVEAHVDVLEYFPSRVPGPSGPVLGMATYENGRRVAQVATQGHHDIDIVATIVHEAAHLAGIVQVGTYFDEDFAFAVESRFRDHVRYLPIGIGGAR